MIYTSIQPYGEHKLMFNVWRAVHGNLYWMHCRLDEPSTPMLSFTVMGTPRSGISRANSSIDFSVVAKSWSTLLASSMAASNRDSTIAFKTGFTSLHLSMYALTTSSQLICRKYYLNNSVLFWIHIHWAFASGAIRKNDSIFCNIIRFLLRYLLVFSHLFSTNLSCYFAGRKE